MTATNSRDYEVYPPTIEDLSEGYVWIRGPGEIWRTELSGRRRIVRISNHSETLPSPPLTKPVYCEALYADVAYIERIIQSLERRIAWWKGDALQALERVKTEPKKLAAVMASYEDERRRLENRRRQLAEFRLEGFVQSLARRIERQDDKGRPLQERRQLLAAVLGQAHTNGAVFMSEWYRRALFGRADPRSVGPHKLEIRLPRRGESLLWQLWAGYDHPQVVVRIATALAFIGLGVGLVGVALALVVLLPRADARTAASVLLGGFALASLISGVAPLWKRANAGLRQRQ